MVCSVAHYTVTPAQARVHRRSAKPMDARFRGNHGLDGAIAAGQPSPSPTPPSLITQARGKRRRPRPPRPARALPSCTSAPGTGTGATSLPSSAADTR